MNDDLKKTSLEQTATKVTTQFNLVQDEEGMFEMYCNFIDVAWTLFDVTLRLAQVLPLNPEKSQEGQAVEQARITMAWPELKFLGNVINQLVQSYESLNGELKPLKLAKMETDKLRFPLQK